MEAVNNPNRQLETLSFCLLQAPNSSYDLSHFCSMRSVWTWRQQGHCCTRQGWQVFVRVGPPLGPLGLESWCVCLQLVDRFAPFLLQWCLLITRTPYHQKPCDLVWWVACCNYFLVKSGVHAAGNQTFLPIPATFKLRCYQQLPLGTEIYFCQSWPPHSIHISKLPPLGASVDPLWHFPAQYGRSRPSFSVKEWKAGVIPFPCRLLVNAPQNCGQ